MSSQVALPEWVIWIQALGPASAGVITALVAIAVAIVALRQWRTAHDKLRLDLFNLRFECYSEALSATLALMNSFVIDGKEREVAAEAAIDKIFAISTKAEVLFPDDVYKKIQALWGVCARVKANFRENRNYSARYGISHDAAEEVRDRITELTEAMKPHLRLAQRLR